MGTKKELQKGKIYKFRYGQTKDEVELSTYQIGYLYNEDKLKFVTNEGRLIHVKGYKEVDAKSTRISKEERTKLETVGKKLMKKEKIDQKIEELKIERNDIFTEALKEL